MNPPPKLVRRFTTVPLFVIVALSAMALAPVAILTAFLVDLAVRNRFRFTRIMALGFVWAFFEVVGIFALFMLWILGGFSAFFRLRIFEDIHYALLGLWLGTAVWMLSHALDLDIHTDELSEGLPEGRVLLFARHAGPADSLLIVNGLLQRARRPRIVAKAALQWDPFIDVAANRVPFHFVGHGSRDAELASIAELASGMGDDGAFLLFPEGGNFTTGRREKAITSLEQKGLAAYAEAAKAMPNLLPPRPNGALTALDAAPDASVVMLGHTGLEDIQGIKEAIRAVPFQNPVWVRSWDLDPSERAPAGDREAEIEWLFRWWAEVDRWIGEKRAEAATP